MQGENIIRTQEIRKKRLQDLGVTKDKKSSTLEVQSKEMATLEDQKSEQDKVVQQLKKQGKDLNARIAEKQKQMAKVNAAVKAAIAAAIKAEAARKAAEKLAADKARRDAAAAATANNSSNTNNSKTTENVKRPVNKEKTVIAPANKTLNDENENIALSASFKNNQGKFTVARGSWLNIDALRTELFAEWRHVHQFRAHDLI